MDKEDLQDIRDYDAAKAELEKGEDELIPSEVVFAIIDVKIQSKSGASIAA